MINGSPSAEHVRDDAVSEVWALQDARHVESLRFHFAVFYEVPKLGKVAVIESQDAAKSRHSAEHEAPAETWTDFLLKRDFNTIIAIDKGEFALAADSGKSARTGTKEVLARFNRSGDLAHIRVHALNLLKGFQANSDPHNHMTALHWLEKRCAEDRAGRYVHAYNNLVSDTASKAAAQSRS